jgi:uncharacterized phiE125 gp8 family phage protein
MEPVSLGEAKGWLRIDGSDEDELVASLIAAARQYVEDETGLALVAQTWELVIENPERLPWCAERRPSYVRVRLPRRPVRSVESVTYRSAGSTVTLAASNYKVVGDELVFTGDAPLSDEPLGVTITFVAGYGDPIDVPDKYRQAIRLLVAHGYENREPVVIGTVPYAVQLSVRELIGARKVRIRG